MDQWIFTVHTRDTQNQSFLSGLAYYTYVRTYTTTANQMMLKNSFFVEKEFFKGCFSWQVSTVLQPSYLYNTLVPGLATANTWNGSTDYECSCVNQLGPLLRTNSHVIILQGDLPLISIHSASQRVPPVPRQLV